MLDHYYTPRDNHDLDSFSALPFPRHLDQPLTLPTNTAGMNMLDVDLAAKPRHPAQHATVVDLSALALEQLVAFDCDESGSESGSDDGYVSTLLRMQRAPLLPSPGASPRKIAGARRVARAVSAPQPQTQQTRAVPFAGMGAGPMMEVDAPVEFLTGATNANANMGSRTTKAPAGELFQSITAIPGLESTSFEELRLETYLQSLVATGTARPQPAFARSGVIPPGFAAQFVGADASGEGAGEGAEGEGEGDADADALSGSYRSREGVKQGDEHEDGGHAQGGVERKGKARVRDVDMLDVEAPHPHPHPNAPVGRTRDPRLRAGDPRVRLHQHPHSTVGVGRAASFPPAGGEVGW